MYKGYFDGAARPNPGPAAGGAVIYKDGVLVWKKARTFGVKTNNQAEYGALWILLNELEKRQATGCEIFGDSQLVINQITGKWACHDERLLRLYVPIIKRLENLNATCKWIKRDLNAEADAMSNYALTYGDFEWGRDA